MAAHDPAPLLAVDGQPAALVVHARLAQTRLAPGDQIDRLLRDLLDETVIQAEVTDILTVDEVNDVFADVDRVVADPLQ